jgi:hypothetical protein
MSIPMIMFAVTISALLGGGLRNVVIALGVALIPTYARLMCGQVLTVKQREYINAYQSIAAGSKTKFSSQYIFLLKTLPCLEQQKKGITKEILDCLDFEYLVVSFPTRSLTGKKKGMDEFYGNAFRGLMDERGWQHKSFEIPNELFFVISGGGKR